MRIALTYNEKRDASEAHAEFDSLEAMAAMARLVASLGHHATPVDVSGSIPALVERLERLAPDVIFNFAEGERGVFREAFYPALFDQLGIPCTGSSPSTLALCLDKRLAKKVVAAARVRVPRERPETGQVIVKPNFEGSSKGITEACVVDAARAAALEMPLRLRYPAGVLVEEYIPGIDVAVAWIDGIGQLPAIAYRHDGEVYDYARKHVVPEAVRFETPAALAPPIARRLGIAADRAFSALGVTGYGRADFRITPDGDVVFLELNPLPSLTLAVGHDEMFVAAAKLGLTPRDVIAKVISGATKPSADGVARRAS